MTVNPADCLTILKADGVGKEFSFTFRIFLDGSNSHSITVRSLSSNGTYRTFQEGIDYTIEAQPQGGIVKFFLAPAVNLFIIMQSAVPMEQDIQFQSGLVPDGFVVTDALDLMTMKIVQCCCDLANKASIDRDPTTGQVPKVVFKGALSPSKIIETDADGKIVSSNFTAQDLIDLGTAAQAALQQAQTAVQTAQTAAQTAQTAQTQAQGQAQSAGASAHAASASQTAAQTALTDTQKVAHDAQTALTDTQKVAHDAQTTLTDTQKIAHDAQIALTDTQKVAHDAQTAQKLAESSANTAQTANTAAQAAAQAANTAAQGLNAEVQAMEAKLTAAMSVLQPLVTATDNPADGDILVADTTGHWVKKPGPDFLDALLKVILNNDQLLGRTHDKIVGFPASSLGGGGGADLGAVFTGVPAGQGVVSDPTATEHYVFKPLLAIDKGSTNSAVTVDPVLKISDLRSGGCFPLESCYDSTTGILTLRESNIMSGSSTIPQPIAADQILTTETAPNGGIVYGWHNMLITKPTAADDGKIWVYDAATSKFVLQTPLLSSDASKHILGVTGVVGALKHQETRPEPTLTLGPFTVVYTNRVSLVTSEHAFAGNSSVTIPSSLTSSTGNFWVYVDPADWTIKTQLTPFTHQDLVTKVALLEAHVSAGLVDAVNFLYNPIANQEYILRELGIAVGVRAKGVLLTPSSFGLMATGTGMVYKFLGSTPVSGYPSGMYKVSGLLSALNSYALYGGTAMHLLPLSNMDIFKKYDHGGVVTVVPANKFAIHHIFLSPLTTTSDEIRGFIVLLGEDLFDSIDEAKQHLFDSESSLFMGINWLNNAVLVGKLVSGASYAPSAPATFYYLNTANISSSGASVVHESVLPDPIGVADGTPMIVQKGKYVFDPGTSRAALPVLDPANIHSNDVLVYSNNKIVGQDPSTLNAAINDVSSLTKSYYAIFACETDSYSHGLYTIPSKIVRDYNMLAQRGIKTITVELMSTNGDGTRPMRSYKITHDPIAGTIDSIRIRPDELGNTGAASGVYNPNNYPDYAVINYFLQESATVSYIYNIQGFGTHPINCMLEIVYF